MGVVKQWLGQQYPGHPAPSRQTIIYAGKVLRDDSTVLRDVIKQDYNPDVPYTLHLVVKDLPSPAPGPLPSDAGAAADSASAPQPATAQQSTLQQTSSSSQPAAATGGAAEAGPSQQAPPDPHLPYPYGASSSTGTAWDADAMGFLPQVQGYAFAAAYPNPYMYANNAALSAMYNAAYAAYECASQAPGGAVRPPTSPAPVAYVTPWGLIPPPQPTLILPVPNAATPQGQAGLSPAQAQQLQHQPFMHFAPLQMAPMPYGFMPYPHGIAYPPGYPMHFHVPGQPGPQGAGAPGMPPLGNRQPFGAAVPRRPIVRVRMLRINVRMFIQLLVVFLIIYQHCSPGRFLLLVIGGLLLYLTTLTPLRRLLHRLVGLPQPGMVPMPAAAQQQGPLGGRPGAGGAEGQQAGAAADAGAAGPQQAAVRQPPGLLRELQALVMGFFTSLLPGWNYNPEDAAAFAAAQEIIAHEEEQQQQMGAPGAAPVQGAGAEQLQGAVPAREHQD